MDEERRLALYGDSERRIIPQECPFCGSFILAEENGDRICTPSLDQEGISLECHCGATWAGDIEP